MQTNESDQHDPTNPNHYRGHPSGIECIQVVEHLPFLEGNVIKYVWRWRDKGGVEDLKKAKWYLERLIAKEGTNGSEAK